MYMLFCYYYHSFSPDWFYVDHQNQVELLQLHNLHQIDSLQKWEKELLTNIVATKFKGSPKTTMTNGEWVV